MKFTSAGPLYRLGLALLQSDTYPPKITHRTRKFVMGPIYDYERTGDVGGAIFPCGWLNNNGEISLYYGAADTSICLATAPLEKLLHCVLQDPV